MALRDHSGPMRSVRGEPTVSTGEVSGEGKQGVPSMYDLALGVLASITNSTRAPTRRDKAEVGHLAAMLALVDAVNGLRADLADRRDAQGEDRDTFFDEVTH